MIETVFDILITLLCKQNYQSKYIYKSKDKVKESLFTLSFRHWLNIISNATHAYFL